MTLSLFPEVIIRELNIEFRRMGPLLGGPIFDGLWLISGAIQARGPCVIWSAILKTQLFDARANGEQERGRHEFGQFELDGEIAFWQIEYVERGTTKESVDPTVNARTCRIISIMFEGED